MYVIIKNFEQEFTCYLCRVNTTRAGPRAINLQVPQIGWDDVFPVLNVTMNGVESRSNRSCSHRLSCPKGLSRIFDWGPSPKADSGEWGSLGGAASPLPTS